MLTGVIVPWTLAAAGCYPMMIKERAAKNLSTAGDWFKWMRSMGRKTKSLIFFSVAMQLFANSVIVTRMQSEWHHVASTIQELYENEQIKDIKE